MKLVLVALFMIAQKGCAQSVTVSTTTELQLQTTTEEMNATTDVPLNTSEGYSTEMPKTKNVAPENVAKTNEKTLRNKLCTCNLQLNVCDINCCCDKDCSSNHKQVFDHCANENRHYDTRYCEFAKYNYINTTPLEWNFNQNSLFCVIKSNLPPSYTIQRKHPLKTFDVARAEQKNKFSWRKPVNKGLQRIPFLGKEKFLYGSHVWLVRKPGIIATFQLPNNFITNRCLIKEEVFAMKNMENFCTHTDISEENPYLSMESFFRDTYVIAAPNMVNISKYRHDIFQDCPRNICLPIVPKICDLSSNSCFNMTKNDTRTSVKCNLNLRENKNTCTNVVKSVEYNFHHGFLGFTEITVSFTMENITSAFWNKDVGFTQKLSVNFWWNNQTMGNFSEHLSGSPGYLVGKPILLGRLVNTGNKTNENLEIKRNSSKSLENFLTLPENKNGYCVLAETTHLTIEFGYNLLSSCRIQGDVVNHNKTVNATEVCRQIQTSILTLWGLGGEKKVFGSFGNANANTPSDWMEILYEISPESVLNKTVGKFNPRNGFVSCAGLVGWFNIGIYHSRFDVDDLLNQEKILAVTYSFGFVNKSFVFDNVSRSVPFEMDLESQVVFYDISGGKVKKLVDAPSLDIRLPYDFFYPFIKVNNGVWTITSTFIVWFNILLLSAC